MNGILWLQIHAINLHLPCIVLVLMRLPDAACYPITPQQSHTLSNPAQPFKGISAFRKENGLKNVLVIVSIDENVAQLKLTNQNQLVYIWN